MSVHKDENGKPYSGDERRKHPYKAGADAKADEMPQLLRMAKREISDRQVRREVMKTDFLGASTWDILLELYVTSYTDEKLSGAALSAVCDIPRSTVHRHLVVLEKAGLITKEQSDDGRMLNIVLTQTGHMRITDYFVRKVITST
ncbi:MarR family transcriptional regulator [Croceicoccus sediminis]|uniref:MarR family transcriptional regulator n=1 Tax=Croceicoccus sediminis TaxID=2571150 RepID=UPI0011825058|nr:helix-turn-helix domain-containing protein [Croceicoccus sediminis]